MRDVAVRGQPTPEPEHRYELVAVIGSQYAGHGLDGLYILVVLEEVNSMEESSVVIISELIR